MHDQLKFLMIYFQQNNNSNFINKDNHLFYSGVCIINKELLKKNLNIVKKNFELNLFNRLIRQNKTKIFFDKGEFRDFNNLEDIHENHELCAPSPSSLVLHWQ